LLFKIYEAHYLTLTAGPNQTAKEKTQSGSYYSSVYQDYYKTVQETFCGGDVLYGVVLSRRRFVCAPYIYCLKTNVSDSEGVPVTRG
jgi:hypothetical protein